MSEVSCGNYLRDGDNFYRVECELGEKLFYVLRVSAVLLRLWWYSPVRLPTISELNPLRKIEWVYITSILVRNIPQNVIFKWKFIYPLLLSDVQCVNFGLFYWLLYGRKPKYKRSFR